MEMTLFDFDFSHEKEVVTFEMIEEGFQKLRVLFKNRRNPHFMGIRDLPNDIRRFIDDYEKEGWIVVKRGAIGIDIPDEHLLYPTIDELLIDYRTLMEQVTSNPDVCWYGDVLSARNSFGQIRYKNKEEQYAFYEAKSEITKEFALKLGLDHFMNKPSARGSVMSTVSSKWAKKHVLPTIAELVIPITDINEMESLFRNTSFFFGRRDWDWNCKDVAPYPVFKRIGGTEFDFACLCQATDQKTVGLILNYIGYSTGHLNNDGKEVIYPNGWSMEKYEESLTDEDKKMIHLDGERLKSLRKVM